MTSLMRFKRGFEAVLAAFCVLLMVSLFVLVIVAVAYRQAGASLTWYDEVATVILAWLTYYGSALAALKRGHLGSPEVMRRIRASLRLPLFVIGETLVIVFFIVLAWAGLEVVILLEGDRLISLTWVPVQLTQSVIPIGALLFVVAQLMSIPDEWRRLGGEAGLPTERI
jgi:TRAP-type C4-dicarboxylate transport system permease small subunit